MIDYETLRDENKRRLIGFGRYAGVVGCYNGFLAYGLRTKRFALKPANECYDRIEMERELLKVDLPAIKIILTGNGRVGGGALEILEKLGIKKVSKEDFVSKTFDESVYVQLDFNDYYARVDGSEFIDTDFFKPYII